MIKTIIKNRVKNLLIMGSASLLLTGTIVTQAQTQCNGTTLSPLLTTEKSSVPGTVSQPETVFRVIFPEGYDATDENKKYPVIYLLHGAGTNVNAATIEANILIPTANRYQCAVEAGLIEPSIFILPQGGNITSMWGDIYPGIHCEQGSDFRGPNEACLSRRDVDGNEYQIESSIFNRVIPYVEENFNIDTSRNKRALLGFSMGGFGSMLYAFKYPEKFSCAVSLDGALHTTQTLSEDRFGVFESFYANDPNFYRNIDIFHQAEQYANWIQQHPEDEVKLRLSNGALNFQSAFVEHLDSLGITSTNLETGNPSHNLRTMLDLEPEENFIFINSCFDTTPPNPDPIDHWEPVANQAYFIRTGDLSLHTGGGGANVIQNAQALLRTHLATAQKIQWFFEPLGDTGNYHIRSIKDPSFYLTVSSENNTDVVVKTLENNALQEWQIDGTDPESIKLINIGTNGLAVSAANQIDNTPVFVEPSVDAISWSAEVVTP